MYPIRHECSGGEIHFVLMELKCNLYSLESALISFARPYPVITKAWRITKPAFSKWTEETLQLRNISFSKVDLNGIFIKRISKDEATQFDSMFHYASKKIHAL